MERLPYVFDNSHVLNHGWIWIRPLGLTSANCGGPAALRFGGIHARSRRGKAERFLDRQYQQRQAVRRALFGSLRLGEPSISKGSRNLAGTLDERPCYRTQRAISKCDNRNGRGLNRQCDWQGFERMTLAVNLEH